MSTPLAMVMVSVETDLTQRPRFQYGGLGLGPLRRADHFIGARLSTPRLASSQPPSDTNTNLSPDNKELRALRMVTLGFAGVVQYCTPCYHQACIENYTWSHSGTDPGILKSGPSGCNVLHSKFDPKQWQVQVFFLKKGRVKLLHYVTFSK